MMDSNRCASSGFIVPSEVSSENDVQRPFKEIHGLVDDNPLRAVLLEEVAFVPSWTSVTHASDALFLAIQAGGCADISYPPLSQFLDRWDSFISGSDALPARRS